MFGISKDVQKIVLNNINCLAKKGNFGHFDLVNQFSFSFFSRVMNFTYDGPT